MKLFLAVAPLGLTDNPELLNLVGKLKRTVHERGQTVRWVPPELWHVTLAFLGSVNQLKLAACLDQWRPKNSGLELSLRGLGAFPEVEAARVLWVGVQATQSFYDLQADLAQHLRDSGIEVVDRAYQPHLTLGRFRNVIGAQKFIELGGRKKFGEYKLRELILFASVLQGNILKYTPQRRWPL